jgi:hypothetical protein
VSESTPAVTAAAVSSFTTVSSTGSSKDSALRPVRLAAKESPYFARDQEEDDDNSSMITSNSSVDSANLSSEQDNFFLGDGEDSIGEECKNDELLVHLATMKMLTMKKKKLLQKMPMEKESVSITTKR